MKNLISFLKRLSPVIAACVLSCMLLISARWLRSAALESAFNIVPPAGNTASLREEAQAAPSLNPPSEGGILMHFSGDALVFNPTLGIYETHPGTDYFCPDENVRAVSDGVVKRIYDDMRLGLTIEIEHENGDISRYASLSKALVHEKGRITGGQIIALFGTSALFESSLGPHVHFEYIKNGNLCEIPFTQQCEP